RQMGSSSNPRMRTTCGWCDSAIDICTGYGDCHADVPSFVRRKQAAEVPGEVQHATCLLSCKMPCLMGQCCLAACAAWSGHAAVSRGDLVKPAQCRPRLPCTPSSVAARWAR